MPAAPGWIHLVELMLFIAVVAVIVIAIVLIVRVASRTPRVAGVAPMAATSPALAELDLRYARGEIDHDDYARRRAALLGTAPPAPETAAPEQPPTESPQGER